MAIREHQIVIENQQKPTDDMIFCLPNKSFNFYMDLATILRTSFKAVDHKCKDLGCTKDLGYFNFKIISNPLTINAF